MRTEPSGTQVERTFLAWARTLLLLALLGALALRVAVSGALDEPWQLRPAMLLPAMLALGSAPVLLVVAQRRARRLSRRVAAGDPVAAPGLLRGMAALVVLFSLACALAVTVR